MNREEFKLPLFKLTKYMIRPFLRCVFNTLLFNRMIHKELLINTFDCDIMNVSYIKLMDKSLQLHIEEDIQSIYKTIDNCSPFTINFSFFSFIKKNGLLRKYKEKFIWETWCIPIKCIKNNEISIGICSYMSTLLQMVMNKQNHIIPITNTLNINYFTIDWNKKPKKRRLSWKKVMSKLSNMSPPEFNITF